MSPAEVGGEDPLQVEAALGPGETRDRPRLELYHLLLGIAEHQGRSEATEMGQVPHEHYRLPRCLDLGSSLSRMISRGQPFDFAKPSARQQMIGQDFGRLLGAKFPRVEDLCNLEPQGCDVLAYPCHFLAAAIAQRSRRIL